jgi:hypothetical protein
VQESVTKSDARPIVLRIAQVRSSEPVQFPGKPTAKKGDSTHARPQVVAKTVKFIETAHSAVSVFSRVPHPPIADLESPQ